MLREGVNAAFAFALPPSGALHAALSGIDLILHVIAEFVKAQTRSQQQPAVQQTHAFLRIAGFICNVRMARVVTPVGTRPSRGYSPTLIWLS